MAHLKVFKQRLLQQFQDEKDSKLTGATSVASETPAHGKTARPGCSSDWASGHCRWLSLADPSRSRPAGTPGPVAYPSPASSSQLRPVASGKSPVAGSEGPHDADRCDEGVMRGGVGVCGYHSMAGRAISVVLVVSQYSIKGRLLCSENGHLAVP